MRSYVVWQRAMFHLSPCYGSAVWICKGHGGVCMCMYIFSLYSAIGFGYSFFLSLSFPVGFLTDHLYTDFVTDNIILLIQYCGLI